MGTLTVEHGAYIVIRVETSCYTVVQLLQSLFRLEIKQRAAEYHAWTGTLDTGEYIYTHIAIFEFEPWKGPELIENCHHFNEVIIPGL